VIEHFLAKLRVRDEISPEEEAAIRAMLGPPVEIPADKTIIPAGVELNVSTLLLDGLLCRYKDLRDGSRQISELHVPGDFADLHSYTLKYLDHSVMALTRCRIATVTHDRLNAVIEAHPHLGRLFWFMTNLDAAIHREWVIALGRRSAISRVAHLFCETRVRLEIGGLADRQGYALGITQADLAECLGLTPVHVNRVLKELREKGLVAFRGGRVEIHDLAGLERIAEFDPAYLYLDKRPR
jgi:CRP-like cAMP-binding protein